jgi:prepilin-type N-terminal cleavage/methylation domain-containing protein
MVAAKKSHRLTKRSGFTLIELLVTLAIIAVVFGITAPLATGWLRMQRISDAVEELRTNWIKARTIAMDEGRTYRFQIMPGNTSYRLAPNEVAFWSDRSQSVNAPTYGDQSESGGWTLEQPLSEGLHFDAASDDLVGLHGSNPDATWLFLADGTARLLDQDGHEHQQASIVLMSDTGQVKHLQMRALTGHSQIITPQ